MKKSPFKYRKLLLAHKSVLASPAQSSLEVFRTVETPERPVAENMRVYLTYKEVFGSHATINQLNTLLSQLNVNYVIRTIAVMNNLYVVTPTQTFQQMRIIQNELVKHFCSSELAEKIKASPFGSDPRTPVFHPQQQLFLLRQALMSCPHEGGLAEGTTANHMFGEACLVANDLIGPHQTREIKGDGNITLAHMINPLKELKSDREAISLVGRAVRLWLNLPEEEALKREADYINFAQVFFDKYGVELEAFFNILFAVFSQVSRTDTNPNAQWEHFVIDANKTFRRMNYDVSTIRKVMAVISYPLADIGNLLHEEPSQSKKHDFTTLKRYPAIEVQDGIYVIYDKEMLLGFFTDGIWWRIYDALPEDRQGAFRSYFGKVYAVYIEQVLSHACDMLTGGSGHELILRPKFNASTEVCDALIVVDDAWVIIETKASLFTTRAKYSEDQTTFEQELNERFFGKPAKKEYKGVSQLAHSIKKLMAGEQVVNAKLDFSKVKHIYMVIISYDVAAVGKHTAAYLDKKARASFNALSSPVPAIHPLTVLSSSDVEAFTALGGRHSLNHLLTSYRVNARPLDSFKDHIFGRHRHDIKMDESFSMSNYLTVHEATLRSFRDETSESVE